VNNSDKKKISSFIEGVESTNEHIKYLDKRLIEIMEKVTK